MPAPGTASTTDQRTQEALQRIFHRPSQAEQLDSIASVVDRIWEHVAADRAAAQASLPRLITGQAAIAEFATLKRPA